MGSLWNATDRDIIITRIGKLNATSARQWGKMNVAEMMTHLIETSKIAFNEKPVELVRGTPPSGIKRWVIIFSPIPWPKGKLPTGKEYLADSSDMQKIDEYKQTIINYVRRFAQSLESIRWGRHAFFNQLTAKEWGALTYKHIDHHLRQFGC